MPVEIIVAGNEHADRIAEISRLTFFETFAAYNSDENMQKFMEGPFHKETLKNEVGAPGNIFLIAVDGTEWLGYARLRINNNPPELEGWETLEIARIYVVGKHIGKGVGNRMMEKSMDIARVRDLGIIWLGVWEHNQRAIEFYIRWGFEKFGTHIFMLGEDAQTDWLMKKDISH